MALEDLKRHLDGGDVICQADWPNPGAYSSLLIILAGGLGTIAKPDQAIGGRQPNSAAEIAREASAWLVALALGWEDLLGMTVVRKFDDFEASLQVVWPLAEPGVDVAVFPDSDIWRGAVFDAVIGNWDRHNGNLLAVPSVSMGQPRLRLVDHGLAFSPAPRQINSVLYRAREGQALPPEVVASLGAVSSTRLGRTLRDAGLDEAAITGVLDRLAGLIQSRRLQA